jgi:uncharacterized membrane protein YfcA
MIVLALILILIGSLAGAAALWLQDAVWWQIALGYVAGGWAGLLVGGLLVLLVRGAARLWWSRPGKRGQLAGMKRHPQGR